MNITNEKQVMVFKKDNKYTVGISNKKQDGSYENAYFPIQFNKGVELEDRTKIYIKNAWLSFYKWEYQDKKGTTFFIKCSDFETVKETIENNRAAQPELDPFEQMGMQVDIDDNFLD